MCGVAEFEVPKRVVCAGVIESPENFIQLESNVGDIVDGVAYLEIRIRNVLSNRTRNVVVAKSRKMRGYDPPHLVVVSIWRLWKLAFLGSVAHVVLKEREAIQRPAKSLHASFRWNRAVCNQRDELADRLSDLLKRCRHGRVRCGLTKGIRNFEPNSIVDADLARADGGWKNNFVKLNRATARSFW